MTALVALALVALAGCLPLQFGVEAPTEPSVSQTAPAGATTSGPAGATAAAGTAPATRAAVVPSPTRPSETPVRSPTPPPSATPTVAGPGANGECALRHTVQRGEGLLQIAALYGVAWQDIARLNDLDNPSLIYAGQVLCLPAGARPPPTPTPSATASVTPAAGSPTASPTTGACVDPPAWFFTPAPPECPAAPALSTGAAAQRFEQGQMLWLAAVDHYFVLHTGATSSAGPLTFLPGPLSLKAGASVDNRVAETPPPGGQQPVSGFGLIWRGEVDGAEGVRAAVGWAVQAEFAYSTSYQCEAASGDAWACYVRAPNGTLLRMAYTPGEGYTWATW